MAFRKPAGLQIERVGWALAAVGVVIFIFVDSLSAGVLTQLAALDGGASAFAGFKMMFDILFIFGTIITAISTPMILFSEARATTSVLAKPLAWTGILFSFIGLVASVLYFVNIALPQVIGISIAVIAIVYGIYGIQITKSER